MTSLLMGPLLGLEAETQYSICFLAGPGCKGASIRINGTLLPASKQADTPRGGLWRASWTAGTAAEGTSVEYRILLDGEPARDLAGDDHWQFHLPGSAEQVRIGYASCNGFSDFKLLTSTPQPYVMWGRLAAEHAAHPFSLLLMGGIRSMPTLSGPRFPASRPGTSWTGRRRSNARRPAPWRSSSIASIAIFTASSGAGPRWPACWPGCQAP